MMKKNKTICVFSAQFFPHLGGVERYVYNISKELVSRGYKVYVITSSMKGQKDVDEFEGIHIIRLPSYGMLNGRMPVLKINHTTKRLMNKIIKEIDFCVVNTRFYRLSLFGVKMAYNYKIPCIIIEHGSAYLTFNNQFLDFIEKRFERWITKKDKKYCKHYYAVSEYSREWLKEFDINGEGVIYNAINPTDYRISDLQGDLKKKLEPITNGISIAYTGRLIPEKGVHVLLEAFNDLRREYKNIYLVLMGEGPLEQDILNCQDPNIIYLGRQENKDVINVLNKVDIFCLPSRSEGFSTSILEAALCKCFIITTYKGGSKELISDKKYGMIIKDNSLENVEQALAYAINNEEYCKEAAKAVYERVIKRFTWEQSVDELEQLMNKYLNTR